MSSRVPQLRRWVGVAAVLAVLTVGGFYFYARWRAGCVPKKLQAAICGPYL